MPDAFLKTGLAQERAELLGRNQEAGRWIARPGHRAYEVTPRTGEDLLKDQPATRAQHAALLGHEPRLVGNVHAGVLGPDHVEVFIGERHLQSAAQEELHRVLEPQSFGERLSGPDKRLGRIQHRYVAAVFGRERARRSTEAAAHIQHLLACSEFAQLRQRSGGCKRATVKVVDTTYILVAQLTADIRA